MILHKKICLWKKDKCSLAENILVILCGIGAICFLLIRLYNLNWLEKKYNDSNPLSTNHAPEITLNSDSETSRPTDANCKLWNCLNIYRCGNNGHDRLTIYVYPIKKYVDTENGKSTTLTREYYQIIDAVVNSHHYCPNPNEACLFLPTIDILNQQNADVNLINRAFASLDYWEHGDNHILFSMIPATYTGLNNSNKIHTDHAIVLDGGLTKLTYRPNFDVALPAWSPELQYFEPSSITSTPFPRKYVLISSQVNIFPEILRQLHLLAKEHPRDMLILHTCKDINNTNLYCNNTSTSSTYLYPEVLSKGTFCLITRTINRGIPNLLEMLAYNCIPVIAVDHIILPFEDVLDWSLASVRIRESEVHALMYKLNEISALKIFEMQIHGLWLYSRYFKDLKTITLTALQILEDRIFPHRARSLIHWNTMDNYFLNSNPLFLPTIASKTKGFTAVILTFDRVESLFTLITKMSVVPSLYSILVIWNNQHKAPPPLSTFPITSKPVKVIQTRENKLSNRFFPYSEIETEAVLTIDDDILMLTSDELDFGFEVWREFPDRIVGFPSRIHIWNNESMQWQYESEWTNQISMVLTGASFHHKIWNHLYTYNMPIDIKNWVDDHMNCEDIAMNFLVANVTKKAPIKVTPRKKFKCPECVNTEMLSADLNHMRERSSCIDRFAKIYGHMPLRSVEFRADPVLYLDNFPEKLKRFNDVGIL